MIEEFKEVIPGIVLLILFMILYYERMIDKVIAVITQIVLVILVGFLFYLFYFTWPVSLALCFTIVIWWLTRRPKSPLRARVHNAAKAVLIGIGLSWGIVLVVRVAPEFASNYSGGLSVAEQTLLKTRLAVHALSGPHLTTYLLLFTVLLPLLFFFPESRVISRMLRTKEHLVNLHLCLLALTTFTLFAGHEADRLAQADYNNRLQEFEVGLRTEFEPAKEFLAKQAAAEAMNEALKEPITKAETASLVYLMERLREPHYVKVLEIHQVRRSDLMGRSDFMRRIPRSRQPVLRGDDMKVPMSTTDVINVAPSTPSTRTDFMKSGLTDYIKVPKTHQVLRSDLMKSLIDDVSKQVELRKAGTSAVESLGGDVEILAGRRLGQVAESREQWQQQKQLVENEGNLASKSRKFYDEAGKGITQGVAIAFSETLESFLPGSSEVAKEWMINIVETTVMPIVEERVNEHARSILSSESFVSWCRNNLLDSKIHDIPEEVKLEIGVPPQLGREFLIPSFVRSKASTANSGAGDHRQVPADVAQEIDRRINKVMEEVKKEAEAEVSVPPGDVDITRLGLRTEKPTECKSTRCILGVDDDPWEKLRDKERRPYDQPTERSRERVTPREAPRIR